MPNYADAGSPRTFRLYDTFRQPYYIASSLIVKAGKYGDNDSDNFTKNSRLRGAQSGIFPIVPLSVFALASAERLCYDEKNEIYREIEGIQMAKATLVIMAAGMGSRYGGVKQIAGVGPNGEILMEYAIFDALRAGFDKVVFIVTAALKPEIEAKFASALAAKGAEMACVVQDYASLPDWFTVPEGRVKPYGTGHAVYCAKDAIQEPFAVINADDYYGVEGFQAMFGALMELDESHAAMVGYQLKNTVSEHGTVTRGVCQAENGALQSVTETFKIAVFPDGSIRDTADDPNGKLLDSEATVSMNFWGFHPSFFDSLGEYLNAFLKARQPDDLKSECLLPALVDKRIHKGTLTCAVLTTAARWFGMTYQEDHAIVQAEIGKLHEKGVYPAKLW